MTVSHESSYLNYHRLLIHGMRRLIDTHDSGPRGRRQHQLCKASL